MTKIVVRHLTQPQKVRMLYKTVLRLHRGLPAELKDLGDKYAKEEFKRHKKCKPSEAVLFVSEWTRYAVTLTEQLGIRGKPKGTLGNYLDWETLDELNDDQAVQLYELMKAAKGIEDDSAQDKETATQQITKQPEK